jgi:hypothetical protein
MVPPRGPAKLPARPKMQTPAERGAEFAAAQRRLKEEAAERRRLADEREAADPKSGETVPRRPKV